MSKHNRERRQRREQVMVPFQMGDPRKPPLVYQVGLCGNHAQVFKGGRLSDMIESSCANCELPLLAEGEGFRSALHMARSENRTLLLVCVHCFKHLLPDASLERSVAPNYHHEEEFAAALAELRQGRQ